MARVIRGSRELLCQTASSRSPAFSPAGPGISSTDAVGPVLGLGVGLMVRAMKQAAEETPNAECYRWGLFYANPDDPAIWVPKRLGLGWTLNFAHGKSWVMLGLLLLPVLLLLLFALSR